MLLKFYFVKLRGFKSERGYVYFFLVCRFNFCYAVKHRQQRIVGQNLNCDLLL